MGPQIRRLNVHILDWVLRRKIWLYYLIPPDPFGKLTDILRIPIEEEFYKEATRHMNAFLEEGTMPPDQIAPAIFNMLDDYGNGRDVAVRTGDYIAIQGYLRSQRAKAK